MDFSAQKALAIVPDTPFQECREIWVGGAGVVQVQFMDSTTALFTCVAGSRIPVRAKNVVAAGTTATLLVAMY